MLFREISIQLKPVQHQTTGGNAIKEGKIIEVREEVDMMGLLQQLGMELKPKERE